MATGLFNWSQTPGNNATATYNWAEGMAPSAVNDSARGIMADVAKYRDDIAGAIVTGGTSTAYTLTSYSAFTSLALMANQMIAFTPHTTNGATVTLNVDGLGAKPLRSSPSTELLAGVLIQGTPYVATYNNSDAAWYLQSFYGNPYNVPLAAGMPYFATSTPNSAFVFPYGQAISRSVYSALFALLSTNFGAGDGSTTFNLPDLRGRVPAGGDAMGGVAANRLTSASGFSGLFTAAGAETRTLVTANLPAYTPAGTISQMASNQVDFVRNAAGITSSNAGGGANGQLSGNTGSVAQVFGLTQTFTGTAQGGTSTAFGIVQPTIICNYILRVL